MVQEEVRNYEISVWTLQDDFITVLKAANIQRKGQTEEGELKLNVDGTQELSFSIPMYIYDGVNRIENPSWYSYKHGALIANMRKIKVILNKNTEYEDVFEFLIIKVTEKHDKGELYCEVECEGLAFHELGKTGYKISLSPDDFEEEYREWFEDEERKEEDEPQENIQYWLDKFMEPYPDDNEFIDAATWYYSIEMDWSSYTQFNGKAMVPRDSNKIYEDEYVASWEFNDSNDTLYPRQVEGYKEKWRPMEVEESNKYNLTQDLAEKFGVYCKYVYEHDKNYRITARRVIFYNNFIEEDKGPIDITYKYHTSSISREMDCTDLVTKMYIKAVDDDLSESGKITIMDVEANKSKEDYLLNFDYVHAVGAIDDEAYNYIETYEKEMHRLNNVIIPLQNKLITLESKLPEEEAKLTIYSNSIIKAQETHDESLAYINSLTGDDDTIEITNLMPRQPFIKTLNGVRYVDITEKGVKVDSFKLYTTYSAVNKQLSGQINIGKFEYDEFGNVIKATNLSNYGNSNFCYAIYNYSPATYHQSVVDTYATILAENQEKEKAQKQLIEDINSQIEVCQNSIDEKQKEKEKLIKDFELLMGPALREGYWQPEDYNDYGDIYTDSFQINQTGEVIKGQTEKASYIWDTELFDEEQELYYEVGTQQDQQYYPGILLDSLLNQEEKIEWDKIAFIYYDFIASEEQKSAKFKKSMVAGSQAQLVFLKTRADGTIKPALLLTGFKNLPLADRTIIDGCNELENSIKYDCAIGILKTEVIGEGANVQLQVNEEDYIASNILDGDIFITQESMMNNYDIIYPRIKIDSLAVKNSTDQLSLLYNGEKLEAYEDYSVLTRTNEGEEGYYITLDAKALLENGLDKKLDILYTLSNANVSIYLDAIEVMKDSSQPQVSYSVDVAAVQKDYILQVHRMLNRIVHINDPELKFENVQGYVSEVTLNLDKPWEDSIEIKNYKTKFEDLFTKIVASTEAMKKQSYVAGIVSNAFSADGSLQANAMQSVLNNLQTNYKNGKTTFSIDPAHGIIFQNDEGILALRDGGLFGATKKVTNYSTNTAGPTRNLMSKRLLGTEPEATLESSTDWNWKTLITPAGINMKNVMVGQIDTNNVSIFAGDQKRFQLNADGLFAYKSFLTDDISENSTAETVINNLTDQQKELDPNQYVTLNSEGLFLIAEKGARIFNKNNSNYSEPLTRTVKRVEISWNGLTLRNNEGKDTFYADPDTGNLTLRGNIVATGLTILTAQDSSGQEVSINNFLTGFLTDNNVAKLSISNEGWIELNSYNNQISGFNSLSKTKISSNKIKIEHSNQNNNENGYTQIGIDGILLEQPNEYYTKLGTDFITTVNKKLNGANQVQQNITTIYPDYIEWFLNINSQQQGHMKLGLGYINLNNGTNFTINGSAVVTGSKSRVVNTEQYFNRLLYCYETPTPMFGDIGEGIIGEDGYCYVSFDPIFARTITTDQYQVSLQKYGEGDCWILERYGSYFIVQGTPNLKFGWEVKAKQRDYDQLRLEKYEEEPFKLPEQNYGEEAESYINNLKQGRILE